MKPFSIEYWLLITLITLLFYRPTWPAVVLPAVSGNVYSWKSGFWGTCISPSKCGIGQRIRKITCEDSSGYLVDNSNCDESKKPSAERECFRVCDKHRHVLRWEIGHWSPCIPKVTRSPSIPCTGVSIPGVAERKISCILTTTNTKVDISACEYFWDKPESIMSCSLDCPQECVQAKRNVTCILDGCKEHQGWTREITEMIVAPSKDGAVCANVTPEPVCRREMLSKICKSLETFKKRFLLKIEEWSTCQRLERDYVNWFQTGGEVHISLNPVIGISRRNITCITEEGVATDLSFCNVIEMPVLTKQCVVPVDCVVSPWSEWRVEKEGCITSDGKVHPETRTRSRRLLQMPVGAGAIPCPTIFEQRQVSNDLPSCYKYQWYPLEWSECELRVHGGRGEVTIVKPSCGSGLQYRNVTCLRANDMVPVNQSLCKEAMPATIQRCTVSCKRDCQVSHWSRWGPCRFNKSESSIYGEIKGVKRRERSVVVNSLNGGLSCPHLHELDLCFDEDMIDWQYGEWKECVLNDPQSMCGAGSKSRDKTCVKFGGKLLDSIHCYTHAFTYDTDECRIPCPHDCVVSEWSQWSTCSVSCYSGEEGVQTRNKTLLAVAGAGGACQESMSEDKFCNLRHCHLFKWQTDDWGPCTPSAENTSLCGVGTQKRNVFCTRGDNVTNSDKRCKLLPMPENERECHYPCPVDCIVTNFTDWTPCEPDCETNAVQYKHRLILQFPKHGGKPCPEAIVEARPCSETLRPYCLKQRTGLSTRFYQWSTSAWSDCYLPVAKQHCGMGFQVRNVSCSDTNDREVEPYNCLSNIQEGVPSALRSCEVTCSAECVLTTWGSWSNCNHTYKSRRSRHRELVGTVSPTSDCHLKFKLTEEEECPIIPTSMPPAVTHWMSCIVEEENMTEVAINGQIVRTGCGDGYRYKYGLQMNSVNNVEPGLERDFCWVDCPIDCQMSEWTEWSSCNVPCGRGFKERRRHILVQANELGRPCPETEDKTEIQRDICHIVCADFYWLAGGWTHCKLDDEEVLCGKGTHHRSIRCLNKWTDEEVDESKCDPILKPISSESCTLYCPGECVVSSWTLSKKCSEPCSRDDFQEQTRIVLRYPNATLEPCPSLIFRTPCVLNETCYEHYFDMGSWGSCVLPEGAVCGEGVKKRPLLCMRSDGRQVDAVQCEKNHRSPSLMEPVSKPCYIDCPTDCVLSEWSEWNNSACSPCGAPGFATRTRYQIQSPSDGGQPCSSEMEQQKPCNFKPCYHWKHSEWSACDLQAADCGYGVQRRVVECIRYDGLRVDKINCLTVNLTFLYDKWLDSSWLVSAQDQSQEEQSCHVPCPGDCIMTEWTHWSHCQRNCRIGQIVGYQTSSRKILFSPDHTSETSCPTDLWKTRPCWTGDCNFFQWKLINSSLECKGMDGRTVKGGCTSEPLPCEHWCQKLGGRCNSTSGFCLCDNGGRDGVIIEDHTSLSCKNIDNGPHPPANHSAPTQVRYYPDDSQASFWMYAMISIGIAFVVFVSFTVYLMCRSSLRLRSTSVERQPSVRRRLHTNQETNHCLNPSEISAVRNNSFQ